MLSDADIEIMRQKALEIKEAIWNDDYESLTAALVIDCLFCTNYLIIKPLAKSESFDPCVNCPMSRGDERVCHYNPGDITDYRIVDRYWIHFDVQHKSHVHKDQAIRSIENIITWIDAYIFKCHQEE